MESARAFPTFRALPGRVGRGIAWLWRKTWRYTAALVALLLLAHLALNAVAGRQLGKELARLRAQGAPLTLAQAAPPPVPDSENAAGLYEKAFAGLRLTARKDVEAVRHFLGSAEGARAKPPRPTLAEMEAILARHEADFRLLEQGSKRPVARFPVDWEHPAQALFPHLARVRNATRFLCAKAVVDTRHGRAGDALQDLAISIRMSNHISAEPTIIAQYFRVACISIVAAALPQVMAAPPPTAAESRAFYDLLSKVDIMGPWVRSMEGERTFGLSVFDELRHARSGEFAYGLLGGWVQPEATTGVLERFLMWAGRVALTRAWPLTRILWQPFLRLDEVQYLRHMQVLVALAGKSYEQNVKGQQRLEKEKARLPWYAVVTNTLAPIFTRATQARDEARATVGVMQAALALRDYQIQHGSYPASLSDLRAAGGWAIPHDPFSGKPFLYRREGAGYLVYSVGPDLKDDGGIGQWHALRAAPRPISSRPLAYDLPLRMTR
jgi:hypothetical protein